MSSLLKVTTSMSNMFTQENSNSPKESSQILISLNVLLKKPRADTVSS